MYLEGESKVMRRIFLCCCKLTAKRFEKFVVHPPEDLVQLVQFIEKKIGIPPKVQILDLNIKHRA